MKLYALLAVLLLVGCSRPTPPSYVDDGPYSPTITMKADVRPDDNWESLFYYESNQASFYRDMYEQAAMVACRDHPQLQFMAIQKFGKDSSMPVISSCWQINAYNQKEPHLQMSQPLNSDAGTMRVTITDGRLLAPDIAIIEP